MAGSEADDEGEIEDEGGADLEGGLGGQAQDLGIGILLGRLRRQESSGRHLRGRVPEGFVKAVARGSLLTGW
ncbi:MAG: hypothetical protein IVW54_06850 [Candidatus Binataceae bacterium]|nr:hypothetical protein [Candidatus Binataceae bacterium]